MGRGKQAEERGAEQGSLVLLCWPVVAQVLRSRPGPARQAHPQYPAPHHRACRSCVLGASVLCACASCPYRARAT